MNSYDTIATYTDRQGALRDVGVDVDEGGRFRVLDIGADGPALLVVVLRDYEQSFDHARRVARDYARQMTDYLAGARDEMPCPDPLYQRRQTVTVRRNEPDAPARRDRRRRRDGASAEQGSLLAA